MPEPISKLVLHLELDLETSSIRCEIPNNFVVALGVIATVRAVIERKEWSTYEHRVDGKVSLHADIGAFQSTTFVELRASPLTALGLLDYARELVMEKAVRPSFKTKVALVSSDTKYLG